MLTSKVFCVMWQSVGGMGESGAANFAGDAFWRVFRISDYAETARPR